MAILKKFVPVLDGSKVLLDNQQSLRAKKANGDAQDILKLDADGVLQLQVLPQVSSDPTDDKDLARKKYVDDAIQTGVTDLLGQPNGIAPLDESGKIPNQFYSSLVITDVFVVADIAARDALSEIEEGDVAKVLDAGNGLPKTYIYGGSNWIEIESGSDVDTVNGQTGNVILDTDDISEGSALYFTAQRAKDAAVANSITEGVTDVAPSQAAVFDALDLKLDASSFGSEFDSALALKTTDDLTEGSALYFTAQRAKDSAVANSITEGVTDVAPSQAAVFQALADAAQAVAAEDATFLKLDGSRSMSGPLQFGGDAAPVQWESAGNTAFDGTTLTKNSGGFFWNASASDPSKAVEVGESAVLEFTVGDLNITGGGVFAGFAPSAGTGYYLQVASYESPWVKVYENDVPLGPFWTYSPGDVFRVEISGGIVTYKQNGVVIYSSGIPVSETLYPSANLLAEGDSITATIASSAMIGMISNSSGALKVEASADLELTPSGIVKMFSDLSMESSKIAGLADGTDPTDAVNKGQLDQGLSEKLSLSGGTMTGVLSMGTNYITDVTYFEAYDASVSESQYSAFRPTMLSMQDDAAENGSSTGTIVEITQSGMNLVQDFTIDAGYIVEGEGKTLTLKASADVVLEGYGGKVKSLSELSLESHKISGLSDGVDAADAVNKGQLDTAKSDAVTDANAYTDGQLDTLSVQELMHESKTLGAGDLTSITVSAPIVGQPWIQVGRVSLVPGDDFTVSGSTITWAGDVAVGGVEALADGDKLSIFYMKAVTPFA